jgi:hypothetical protein
VQLTFGLFTLKINGGFHSFVLFAGLLLKLFILKNPFFAHAKKRFLVKTAFQFSVITLKIATIYPEISTELLLLVNKSEIL